MFNILRYLKNKTPSILQLQNTECGSICLAIIFKHFGFNIPLEILREECNVSRDGVSASSIIKIAQKYGFNATGYSMDIVALKQVSLPVVLHWQFDHFIVLEHQDDNFFYINDPAYGHRKISLEAFSKAFTGIVLEIMPIHKLQVNNNKVQILSRITNYIKDFLLTYKQIILFTSACLLLLSCEPFFLSLINKLFIDYYLLNNYRNLFVTFIRVFIIFHIFKILVSFLFYRSINSHGFYIIVNEAVRFINKLINLPMKFYLHRSTGDISSRVHNLNNIVHFFIEEVSKVIIDICVLLAILILLLFLNIFIGSLVMFAIIIEFTIRIIIYAKLQEFYNKDSKLYASMYNMHFTLLRYLPLIKVHDYINPLFCKSLIDRLNIYTNKKELVQIEFYLDSLFLFLNNVTYILIFSIGGYKVMNDNLSIGSMFVIISLYVLFKEKLSNIIRFTYTLQSNLSKLSRILDITDYEAYIKPSIQQQTETNLEDIKTIEFYNVSFSYNALEKNTITNMSIKINAGEFISIVGSTGSGKSTLIKLLNKLIIPTNGKILINGNDILNISSKSLFQQLGYVSQDIKLYNASLIDNLTLFNQSYNLQTIERIMDDLGILYLFRRYINVRNINLNDELSGGEKQKLEITRALLRKPQVLILDEATSSLDINSERYVLNAIQNMYKIMIINIAHRLSAIRCSNKIILLEHGNLIESGLLVDLLNDHKSKFYHLFKDEIDETTIKNVK